MVVSSTDFTHSFMVDLLHSLHSSHQIQHDIHTWKYPRVTESRCQVFLSWLKSWCSPSVAGSTYKEERVNTNACLPLPAIRWSQGDRMRQTVCTRTSLELHYNDASVTIAPTSGLSIIHFNGQEIQLSVYVRLPSWTVHSPHDYCYIQGRYV